jgi:hypothetical protein
MSLGLEFVLQNGNGIEKGVKMEGVIKVFSPNCQPAVSHPALQAKVCRIPWWTLASIKQISPTFFTQIGSM